MVILAPCQQFHAHIRCALLRLGTGRTRNCNCVEYGRVRSPGNDDGGSWWTRSADSSMQATRGAINQKKCGARAKDGCRKALRLQYDTLRACEIVKAYTLRCRLVLGIHGSGKHFSRPSS